MSSIELSRDLHTTLTTVHVVKEGGVAGTCVNIMADTEVTKKKADPFTTGTTKKDHEGIDAHTILIEKEAEEPA